MFSKMIQIVKFCRSPKREVYKASLSLHFSQGKLCVSFRDHFFTSPLLFSFEKHPSFTGKMLRMIFDLQIFSPSQPPNAQRNPQMFLVAKRRSPRVWYRYNPSSHPRPEFLESHPGRSRPSRFFRFLPLRLWRLTKRFCWTEKRKGETICGE